MRSMAKDRPRVGGELEVVDKKWLLRKAMLVDGRWLDGGCGTWLLLQKGSAGGRILGPTYRMR
jgi:hypothetical protein